MPVHELFSTLGLGLRAGTKKNLAPSINSFLILKILFASLWLASCTHTAAPNDDQAETEDLEEDSFSDGPSYEEVKLPHPAKATAYATRVLITTARLPSAFELSKCADETRAIAKLSSNKDLLAQAQMSLVNTVASNPTVYHYCFYSMMVELDQKLDEGGPMMTELADQFFGGFRALWILGRTLDAATLTDRYFDYLRKRYMQISKDYFGRNLERFRAPSGDDGMGGRGEIGGGVRSKPAGPAPID